MNKQICVSKKLMGFLCVIPLFASCPNLLANEQSNSEKILKLEQMVAELTKDKEKTNSLKSSLNSASKSTYKFGGFIKATALFSNYSDGDLAAGSAARDFYIPGTIPVGGAEESQDFDLGAKDTRMFFRSDHKLSNGSKIKTYIEMDFNASPGGNERVSNSYNPRLRQAYFQYDNWVFGQTWSTFQNLKGLPESLELVAAADGIIFVRQPVVRYSNGSWQFAIENPETTITPFGGGGRIVADDNGMPDMVARYNHSESWGQLSVALLVRELAYESATVNDSIQAVSFNFTGKFKLGEKNDLRVNLNSGSGMGRYTGLNAANGAVIDSSNKLDAIDSTSASVAYRHHWTEQWRSNFIFATFDADNDAALTGTSVTSSTNSFEANLIFSPVPKISLGLGFLSASRELESGDDGDLSRLMFTAKYAF